MAGLGPMSPTRSYPKRRRVTVRTTAGLIVALVALSPFTTAPPARGEGAAEAAGGKATNPYLGQEEAIEAGERIYRSRCVGCHKTASGRGPNIFQTELSEEEFMDVVLHGRKGTGMPPWEGTLSRDDVWKLHALAMARDRL